MSRCSFHDAACVDELVFEDSAWSILCNWTVVSCFAKETHDLCLRKHFYLVKKNPPSNHVCNFLQCQEIENMWHAHTYNNLSIFLNLFFFILLFPPHSLFFSQSLRSGFNSPKNVIYICITNKHFIVLQKGGGGGFIKSNKLIKYRGEEKGKENMKKSCPRNAIFLTWFHHSTNQIFLLLVRSAGKTISLSMKTKRCLITNIGSISLRRACL